MSVLPLVICVDDDTKLLSGLKRSVRPWQGQWDMRFFTKAEDAIAALCDGGEAVVVTDWMMPGMDGLQFCLRLREAERRGDCLYSYIIMLTGRHEIDHTVAALEQGVDDFLSKPFNVRELVARIGAGLRLLDLQRSLRIANERLVSLASTDPLTGLSNRRNGMEIIHEQLELVRRGKQDLSAVMIDLDHFKTVNDEHGHEAGDRLLCAVADRVREACRKYDTVIRWGGDELLVVCPHTDAATAQEIAERMRSKLVSVPIALRDGTLLNVSASFGFATVTRGNDVEAEELLQRADASLYDAKAAGRNIVRGWNT